MVMSALDYGKHVLCEKPLGLNVRQVKEMIEKAKEKKRFLMEACFSRLVPNWTEIRKVVDQKILGEVTTVHVNFGATDYINFPNRFRLGNGCTVLDTGAIPLLDFGIYTIILALWVFHDEKPEKITAIGGKSEIGADTWGNITLEFSNDRKAFLCYSHVDIFPNTAFISCSKGHMVIPESFYNPEKLQVIYGTPKVDAKKELIEHLYKDDPTQYNFGLSCAGLRYEADHVYDCIKTGMLESDNITHEFSLTMAEILQEIRKQLDVVLPHDT
uniref:Trans-1,2-dihydrobenzene-1,2-diol dehydrogenase n=1 Tax=Acrobeloides nanus TaxID=290746 RepID=A0A914CAQ5_9BILA